MMPAVVVGTRVVAQTRGIYLVPHHTYSYGSNCSETAPEYLSSLQRNYGYTSDLSQALWHYF